MGELPDTPETPSEKLPAQYFAAMGQVSSVNVPVNVPVTLGNHNPRGRIVLQLRLAFRWRTCYLAVAS
jgi:hypothetical protein